MYCSPYELVTFRWQMISRSEYVRDGILEFYPYPTIVIQFDVNFQSDGVNHITYLGYTNTPYTQGQPMNSGLVKNVPVENLLCGVFFTDSEKELFLSKYPDSKIPSVHYYNNDGDAVFSSITRFMNFPIVACLRQRDIRETLYEFLTNSNPWHRIVSHCCLHSKDEILPYVPNVYSPNENDVDFSDSLPCGVRSLTYIFNKLQLFFSKCSDMSDESFNYYQNEYGYVLDRSLSVVLSVQNPLISFDTYFFSSPDFHADNAFLNGNWDSRQSWILTISDYVDLDDFHNKMAEVFVHQIQNYSSHSITDYDSSLGKNFHPFSKKNNFLKNLEVV